MDELEESARKWQAYFDGKPYKPKKQTKARINYNRSRTVLRTGPGDNDVCVSQPSAFNHLTEPFLIQIGNEIMEVTKKEPAGRTKIYFDVVRGIAATPIGYHNRGTKVRIVPIQPNFDVPI